MIDIAYVTIGYLIEDSISQKNRIGSQSQYTHMYIKLVTDTQTSMPERLLLGASCVQRFDDSLASAIHITYRILLRFSSL